MNPRVIRRTLATLAAHGVLIEYHLSMRWGQTVAVWGEDGRPVRMTLASATMYAKRLEERTWGLLAE